MKDVKELFADHIGKRISITVLGERAFVGGEVVSASDSHVSLKVGETLIYVFYQSIILVELSQGV
jgi:hypothetical protein